MSEPKGDSNSSAAGPPCRFPDQKVIAHPSSYVPCSEDWAALREGRAFFIRGEVLAQIQYGCMLCSPREWIFYYTAPAHDLAIADDIHVPRQTVSWGSCQVDGRDVLKACRAVRARERRKFRVESIKNGVNNSIRLGLRDINSGVFVSLSLSHILDWNICLDNDDEITVREHLESCYDTILAWLKSSQHWVNIVKNRSEIPSCLNWEELCLGHAERGSLPHPGILEKLLESDKKTWINNAPHHSHTGKSFPLGRWKATPVEAIDYVVGVPRAAQRLYAVDSSAVDEDAILWGCVIAAVEEYCLECVRDSLQMGRFTCTVTLEAAPGTSTDTVRIAECADGSVDLVLSCLIGREAKAIRAHVRETSGVLKLYDELKARSNKGSVLDTGMRRLKISLDALQLPQDLHFPSLKRLREWLESEVNPADPELSVSLRALLRWINGGYQGLPKKDQIAARKEIANRECRLIHSVMGSNQEA